MKNNKRLLTCTLGLMLGVGILTGCGATKEYTVTFKRGNEELHTEIVKDGEKCPEYTPAEIAEYDFMGWYDNRQHTGDPFNFDTPITSDLTLYAWYKAQFKASIDTYYVVGSFAGGAWDGQAGAPRADVTDPDTGAVTKGWGDRVMTLNQAELANEHNVFEFTIESIEYGEKFRMIKSTDGVVSDGWVDSYGFDIVNKIYDEDGVTEIAKVDAVKEEDSKNIGILIPGKIKVTLDLNSEFNPVGEITLTYIEKREIVFPEFISLIGVVNGTNWDTDIDLTSEDEGRTWTGTVTFAAGDQFKIRAGHDWAISWGWASVTSAPEGFAEVLDAEGNGTGNIGAAAGTYVITFAYLGGSITITAA